MSAVIKESFFSMKFARSPFAKWLTFYTGTDQNIKLIPNVVNALFAEFDLKEYLFEVILDKCRPRTSKIHLYSIQHLDIGFTWLFLHH